MSLYFSRYMFHHWWIKFFFLECLTNCDHCIVTSLDTWYILVFSDVGLHSNFCLTFCLSFGTSWVFWEMWQRKNHSVRLLSSANFSLFWVAIRIICVIYALLCAVMTNMICNAFVWKYGCGVKDQLKMSSKIESAFCRLQSLLYETIGIGEERHKITKRLIIDMAFTRIL